MLEIAICDDEVAVATSIESRLQELCDESFIESEIDIGARI